MYNIERKALIIDMLEKENTINVVQLAEMLGTSKETIRRDLRELEQKGLIKRTHGGAIYEAPSNSVSEHPFTTREIQHYLEKAAICKCAAAFVEDGDTIFVDNSSTTINLLKHIRPTYQVTVITNSIRLLVESTMVNNPNLTIISLGGIFRAKNLSLSGGISVENAGNFRPNKTFMSCRSIGLDTGLCDGSIYEMETKRTMLKTSGNVYVLADHSKFHGNGPVYLAELDCVARIITDGKTDKDILRQLSMRGIEITVAE